MPNSLYSSSSTESCSSASSSSFRSSSSDYSLKTTRRDYPRDSEDKKARQKLISSLPTEIWLRIFHYCQPEDERALSEVDDELASLIDAKDALWMRRCSKNGVTLPSEEILQYARDERLPMDFERICVEDPFGETSLINRADIALMKSMKCEGCSQFASASALPAHVVDHLARERCIETAACSSTCTQREPMTRTDSAPCGLSFVHLENDNNRGSVELLIDLVEEGIPHWMIDGLRPRLTASAVMKRCSNSSAKLSAFIALQRIDTTGKKEQLCCNIGTLDRHERERRIEFSIDERSLRHDHWALIGTCKLKLVLSCCCDVALSDVRLALHFPAQVPERFSEWLAEGEASRNVIKESKTESNLLKYSLFL